MPTPAQTSLEEIVRAGRDAVEGGGLDALTMSRVAHSVGVRAPSLYKRVRNRDDLIRLVVESVATEVTAELDAVAAAADPGRSLRGILVAARRFAHGHPEGYALLFARPPERARPDSRVLADTTAAILRSTAELAGEEHALPAARTIVSWLHGFVAMELSGGFRLGGDVDEAFAYGADRLIEAVRAGTTVSPAPPAASVTRATGKRSD